MSRIERPDEPTGMPHSRLAEYAEAGYEIHGRKHDDLIERAKRRGVWHGIGLMFIGSVVIETLRHLT
jgi:hypothetical protein